MRLIVVTGCDEAYAPFARDLINSITRFRDQVPISLGLLDFGLTEATRETFRPLVDAIVKPEWPFRPDPKFDRQIQARAFATRPFLPDYFPGFDAYAWVDADGFVQEARALVYLREAATNGLAGVVPSADRNYNHARASMDWVFERYRMAFGQETATRLMRFPYINSGVVTASAASPMWRMWQQRFQTALTNWNGPRLCDQAILNHVVYLEGLPHHKLPSTCNWISHLAAPVVDVARGLLVEPNYPFDPLLIVANSYNDKRAPRRFHKLSGGMVTCTLTFESVSDAIAHARAAGGRA